MFLAIALDTPLRTLFDYTPPTDLAASQCLPGQRFWVPFGRRREVGILVTMRSRSVVPDTRLRPALSAIDTEPLLDPELLQLLLWSAEYYHHPIGEVLFAALPPTLRAGGDLHPLQTLWQALPGASTASLPARASRLRGVLAQVLAASAPRSWDPAETRALRELQQRGLVQRRQVRVAAAAPIMTRANSSAVTLNEAQATALDGILQCLGRFETLVLKGVTGSGKTEVYLRAIAAVLDNGRQALVLVPEIALTPQLLARFRERFGPRVAVLHSNLNDTERLSAWRAARDGSAQIVIGTRSAVFTPLARPGLIIVDEEHDPSFKQQEGFRYSGRDLAIARAQRHLIPVVLGSATPALESLARAERKPQTLLSLPYRAGSASLPRVSLIDLRRHSTNQGLSGPVLQAMGQHLSADGQILLFLNRRGYAPVLFCPTCGWSAMCLRCEARLTVHRHEQQLRCHHCDARQPLQRECPRCHAPVKPVGQGTERIEDVLREAFRGVPTARIDRDSTRRKGELEAALQRVHSGDARILIGTQMVTKGHHFPHVSLVVVVSADQGLFSADFRASERLAQTIVQVAGRAGREERAGVVLIQTEYPQHPLLQHLLTGGYEAFARAALAERKQAHWPPYARLALLRAESAQPEAPMRFLRLARERAENLLVGSVQLLGPAPAPMARRMGRHRAQLLIKAASHGPLQRCLSTWLPMLNELPQSKSVRWSIDVDPLELF